MAAVCAPVPLQAQLMPPPSGPGWMKMACFNSMVTDVNITSSSGYVYSFSAVEIEFGVRIGVGATSRALMSLVLGEGMRVAVGGLFVGVLASLAGSRFVAALLYGVAPTDPGTIGIGVLMLLTVCALAVLLPARRAARTDPAREVRGE